MQGKRILIIDDDSRNIFALKAVLRSRGFDSITATSAGEGLKHLAEQTDIGIVLLDMMMPEIDGYETVQLIRHSTRSDVPVIAVTAQAMTGDREKCLDAGANEYVCKPVDLDRLVQVINQFMK
jgi:two-component system, cell cycle response regulator DivK